MIHATFYKRPNGRTQEIQITKVYKKDADYINNNMINVSLEEGLGDDVIMYFDDGLLLDDDETPDEIIIFNKGRSCEDTIQEGVKRLKERAA